MILDNEKKATGVAYKLVPKDNLPKDELQQLPECMSQCSREVCMHCTHVRLIVNSPLCLVSSYINLLHDAGFTTNATNCKQKI